MMKPLLRILALAAISGGALLGQNITGTWQGTLKAGTQDLRIVVKITLDDDKLKAMLYSIDQQAPAMVASNVNKEGSTVKITIAGLGSYEGKLSGDGNALTGT